MLRCGAIMSANSCSKIIVGVEWKFYLLIFSYIFFINPSQANLEKKPRLQILHEDHSSSNKNSRIQYKISNN
jgi:hypothetical protein